MCTQPVSAQQSKPVVTRLINNVSFPPKHQSKTWYVLASNVFITSYIHRALHLQFFSSLCTIINSIEGPRKHPTNWAPQLLRPALQPVVFIFLFLFYLFYLPYLSSIHEKANCIAILWTGSPHSLGSCLFRGLWATSFPHKGGASR